LKDFQIGGWGPGSRMGLDPTDAPLMLRDISSVSVRATALFSPGGDGVELHA